MTCRVMKESRNEEHPACGGIRAYMRCQLYLVVARIVHPASDVVVCTISGTVVKMQLGKDMQVEHHR